MDFLWEGKCRITLLNVSKYLYPVLDFNVVEYLTIQMLEKDFEEV